MGAPPLLLYNTIAYLVCAISSRGAVTESAARHNAFRAYKTSDVDTREREFERLYRESYPIVYNYVNYRMTDPTAVEDVVANAYLNAARAFDRFDPTRSKFSTWVISIAMNCMRSYYRKERPSVSLEDVAESNFATSGGQDDVNDRELVRQLLTHLDDFERNLIALKYALGYRNVDIARELGMNASTVSTKLANAIAKMRAQLPS